MSVDNFYAHNDNDPCYDRKGHYEERYTNDNKYILYGLVICLILTLGVVIGTFL